MHSATLRGVLQQLRRLSDPSRVQELSDGDLLERFCRRHEEAAFTLLVQRHGPMVLAVCRRILGDAHEAEDAFQATFLVLVRKASTIRKHASLSSWLHVVATHIAHKARAQAARRRVCEREVPSSDCSDNCFDTLAVRELRAALDEEIARLPDKYRTPLVLCYLAEKTHEQAASELGWPKSSVTARLAKARELLQRRLMRRGFTVPAGLLAALLTESTTNAAVSSLLTLSTVRLAAQFQSGNSSAAALAGGLVKGATALKIAGTLALLATLGFAAFVGYPLANHGHSAQKQENASKTQTTGEPNAAKLEPRKPRVDLLGDPLPDGVVARMGSMRLRQSWLSSMSFSADSNRLVSCGGHELHIWDAKTGKLLRSCNLGRSNQKTSFVWTSEGIVFAILDDKGVTTIHVVDLTSGQVHHRSRIEKLAKVANSTLSPDGKRLAVAHPNDLRLYDTTTGEIVTRIPVKGIAAWSIAFAPDSRTVAYNDLSTGTIYLHDVATAKLIREMNRPGDTTLHLVFSPDGRFLAAMPQSRVTEKGDVSIWNVQQGKEVHSWTHPFRLAMSAAFSPDGKQVAIGGGRWGLVQWDVETGKEIRRLSPHGGVYQIGFSPNGKILGVASPRGAIRLYDAATGKLLPASADPDLQFASCLRFSADGKRLFGDAGACLIWDPATGRELRRFDDPEMFDFRLPNDLRCLVLSPDESLLAAANPNGTISLWSAATGKKIHELKGHDRFAWRLMFTPDSRYLISNGSDQVARVWDVASGRARHEFGGRSAGAISGDARYLATVDAKSPTVIVHDLTTGQEIKRFAWPQKGQVFGLAFAPDGRSLAAVGHFQGAEKPGVVLVWNIDERSGVRLFESHKPAIWSVAFSPDSRTLATGDFKGGVLLWEVSSGRLRYRFVGQESEIQALAFSPNGRTLAASSVDAPVYIWDVTGILEPRPRRLSKDELRRSWTALSGDDAAAAFSAIRRLAATPEQTLPFLREHLKPVPAPDLKRVRQLVDMLESADFPTRQKATDELEKNGDAAVGLLRQILAKEKPSLEMRRRLQQIVESIEKKPETLRAVRAVEVLEWIGTPGAVRLLGELANGAADAHLTHEASAAKRRLGR